MHDDQNPWNVAGNQDKPSKKTPQNSNQPIDDFRKKSKKAGGDDIGDIFEELQQKFFKGSSGGGQGKKSPPKNIFSLIGIVFLIIWGGSGFFRVQEGEVAVILRFGKMVRTCGPGLRYHLPAPIEREIVKNVAVVNKIDSSSNHEGESDQALILTGDENMVLTNYTVLWKIKDVSQYLFTARNPETTIRAAAESALREVFGQSTARQALSEGREKIGTQALELLQKILDAYNVGVHIVSVQLQRVEPPPQVIEAFNDMQASLVDADRSRNEAESYTNDIIPKARGEAESIMRAAEGYSAQIVAQAEGEAEQFTKVYESYKLNPKVTRTRLHLNALETILKAADVTIIDHDLGKNLYNHNQLLPMNSNAAGTGKGGKNA